MSKNLTDRMFDAMKDVVRTQAPARQKTSMELMFDLQRQLQDDLAARGKALDLDSASFQDRVNQISVQWRNLTLEFAEMLESLPYKEWKTYKPEDKTLTDRQMTLVKLEYIDMFHFFLNIGLCLGITGKEFEDLYAYKNRENIDRQVRGDR